MALGISGPVTGAAGTLHFEPDGVTFFEDENDVGSRPGRNPSVDRYKREMANLSAAL
jgi:hypothetical protein